MSQPDQPPSRPVAAARRLAFGRLARGEETFLGRALRQETVGGVLMLCTAVLAVGWANSPVADSYTALQGWQIGPLDAETWASDGLLAIFFFLAGVELKRELVVGSLSRVADAFVPVAAALAGMVVPALVYLAVNVDGRPEGWAVPMATDIAFALAVLAVVGRSLPSSLRAFLLTLAVVDDLGAILVIAVVFTSSIELPHLGAFAALAAAYGVLQSRRVRTPVLYVPLAAAAWWFLHESGVHATVAGVTLGMLTRVRPDEDESRSPAETLEHRLRPLSAGVAVPIFALLAAGVGVGAGADLLGEPVFLGIVLGLVVGKIIGVLGGAWLAVRLTRAELSPDLGWRDVAGASALAGIGFTVSLLIADLSFTGEPAEVAKAAVLAGSVVAATGATALLRRRNRVHAERVEAAGDDSP